MPLPGTCKLCSLSTLSWQTLLPVAPFLSRHEFIFAMPGPDIGSAGPGLKEGTVTTFKKDGSVEAMEPVQVPTRVSPCVFSIMAGTGEIAARCLISALSVSSSQDIIWTPPRKEGDDPWHRFDRFE
eukprot:57877-Rhodomonas_salina.2